MAAQGPKSKPPKPVPITVYVVHHPDCDLATRLATKLYEWFRLGYLTGDTGGASVPIYYRRRCEHVANSPLEKRTEPLCEIHPEIKQNEARLNLIILLVDDNIVVSPEWRQAISNLALKVRKFNESEEKTANPRLFCRSELLPVVLDESFYNLSPVYQNHNPVRLLGLTESQQAATLRRAALEVTARTLRNQDPDHYQNLRIFLSHAKQDGTTIAEHLRDGIRRFGQLIPWYDANDLAFARPWAGDIDKSADRETAGMVAVVTDAYPTRPWCRRELQIARTPRRVPKSGRGHAPVYEIKPVVAVLAPGAQWTRGLATLEGVPRVGWHGSACADRTESVVDRLVLEMMLSQVRRATFLDQASHCSSDHRVCFLTWVPDTWTLGALRRVMRDENLLNRSTSSVRTIDPSDVRVIVYPGIGLTPAEQDDLRIQVEAFHPDTKLQSLEQWLLTTNRQAK